MINTNLRLHLTILIRFTLRITNQQSTLNYYYSLIDIELDFNNLTGFTVDYIPGKIYDIQYEIEGYDENVSPWKYLGNNKFEDIWEGSEFDTSNKTIKFDVTINKNDCFDRDEINKVESYKVLNLHDCNPEYRKTHMRSCPNCSKVNTTLNR